MGWTGNAAGAARAPVTLLPVTLLPVTILPVTTPPVAILLDETEIIYKVDDPESWVNPGSNRNKLFDATIIPPWRRP